MPMMAYMKIEGAGQGLITAGASSGESIGNTWQQGHEDQLMVSKIDHKVSKPVDPLNGQPTGSRIHGPYCVRVPDSRATPLLQIMLVKGELGDVEISYWRNRNGIDEEYFTEKLIDATVISVERIMPDTRDTSAQHLGPELEVKFSYRKIVWEHTISGTSGSDDWRDPAVS